MHFNNPRQLFVEKNIGVRFDIKIIFPSKIIFIMAL